MEFDAQCASRAVQSVAVLHSQSLQQETFVSGLRTELATSQAEVQCLRSSFF